MYDVVSRVYTSVNEVSRKMVVIICQICDWLEKHDKSQDLFEQGIQETSPDLIAESGDMEDELLEEARELLIRIRENGARAMDALNN